MSVAHTTPAPAADAAGEGRRRSSLLRRLTGGTPRRSPRSPIRSPPRPEVQQAFWDGYEAGLEG